MAQLSITLKTFAEEPAPDWSAVLDLARIADEAGIDRVVVPDHVVLGEHLDAYGQPELGGRSGGTQPTGPDGAWLEPLTILSVICGLTSRVRLGTAVILAALRRPVVLAKAAATLDVLSGGRLDLGVGVGWQRQEYEAAGLDFDRRGDLLNHTLEVCQTLWREPRASYSSSELRFDAIHLMPKPLQPGGVPIWVSGTVTAPVARRLARFGKGWIPWGPAAEEPVPAIARMKELLAAAGGKPSELQVVGSLPIVLTSGRVDLEATMDAARPLAAAGVSDFRVRLPVAPERESAVEQLDDLVKAFRASGLA